MIFKQFSNKSRNQAGQGGMTSDEFQTKTIKIRNFSDRKVRYNMSKHPLTATFNNW